MDDEQKRKLMKWVQSEIAKEVANSIAEPAAFGEMLQSFLESQKITTTEYLGRRVKSTSDGLVELKTQFLHFKVNTGRTIEGLEKEIGILKRQLSIAKGDILSLTKEIRSRGLQEV